MANNHHRSHGQHSSDEAGPGRLSAPYRFIPLQNDVLYPDWQDIVSHDVPMQGGWCGTLALNIASHSPLLLAVSEEGTPLRQKPFKLPNGSYAIPGSSLRGMIRNVLEIASCAKIKFMDDKRLSVRDLTSGARPIYGRKLTDTKGNKRFKALSQAGWLSFDSEWKITPCEFGRVEHTEINRNLKQPINVRARPTAADKYRNWLKNNKTLRVDYACDEADWQQHSNGKQLYYRKVTNLRSKGKQGHIIFTGQPGPNKHMEFVFFEQSDSAVKIDEVVIRGFHDIYSETDEWKCLELLRDQKNLPGIPVFYLSNGSIIESIGLAMMYKLAYKHTAKHLADVQQSTLTDTGTDSKPELDLAELIFGHVDEANGKNSLKGRVSFSHAGCTETEVKIQQQDATILNGPKSSYFPHYMQQKPSGQSNNKTDKYATLMDDDAKISGWKRYQVHNSPKVQTLSSEQERNTKVQVSLHPIVSKPAFSAKLRFHNLNSAELGALIWTLTLSGENQNLRHSIGMGKPFGFGQISIAIDPEASTIIANDIDIGRLSSAEERRRILDDAQSQYVALMQSHLEGWDNAMTAFLETADPEHGDQMLVDGDLDYMSLGRNHRENKFVIAKNNLMFLPVVSGGESLSGNSSGAERLKPDSPESGWIVKAIDEVSIESKEPQKDKIWFQKGLAVKWVAIEDLELKKLVLNKVINHWEAHGGWGPGKGSRGKAYHIYTAES